MGVYAQYYQPARFLTSTTLPDTLRLSRSGNNVIVSLDGVSPTPLYTYPLDSSLPHTLPTLAGDDRLLLDFSTGNPLPAAGLTFTGSEDSDMILFTTSTTYDSFILSTSTLDLADNSLLISNTTLQEVQSWLQSNRLFTSLKTPHTTLALFPQQDGSILVKLAYYGDVNNDGAVNLNDYFTIDSNYLNQSPSTPLSFHQGDVNHDGAINLNDYFLIDSAYLNQRSPLSGTLASTSQQEGRKTRKAKKVFSAKKVRRSVQRLRRGQRARA